MFKRKLSPDKEADTTRDNVKVSRNDDDKGTGHRLCFKMDLFCLIKLFPLVYIFIESAHFISSIIKYSLYEYLIIPFMLRSTCTPMIISQCISSQLYGINLK